MDIQQSYRMRSIIEQAEIPICAPTKAENKTQNAVTRQYFNLGLLFSFQIYFCWKIFHFLIHITISLSLSTPHYSGMFSFYVGLSKAFWEMKVEMDKII